MGVVVKIPGSQSGNLGSIPGASGGQPSRSPSGEDKLVADSVWGAVKVKQRRRGDKRHSYNKGKRC